MANLTTLKEIFESPEWATIESLDILNKAETNYLIRLTGDTCGFYSGDVEPKVGEEATILLNDENGMPIEITGVVAEILEVN